MDQGMRERWEALSRSPPGPSGEDRRELRLADWRLRIEGLTSGLATALDRRWGAFCGVADGAADVTLTLVPGGERPWLPAASPGEAYRIEAHGRDDAFRVASYHFVLWRFSPGAWIAATVPTDIESSERLVENIARYLVARRAVEAGGVPFHAAGVLRDGRAHLFAGPSRSGKSTAVRNSAPATSLGDDMAIAVPIEGRWCTTALPFDNAERIEADPPRGWWPIAGIWRLFQAEEHRVEEPPALLAGASLMACTSFPWALRDLSDRLLQNTDRLLETAVFRHLHLAPDPGFWDRIG